MREPLLDLLTRLMTLRDELGDPTFLRACQKAKHAIAMVALDAAERNARTPGTRDQLGFRSPHQTRLLEQSAPRPTDNIDRN